MAVDEKCVLGRAKVRRRRPGDGKLFIYIAEHVHSLTVLLLLVSLGLLGRAVTEGGRRRQLDLGLAPDAPRIRRYNFHAARPKNLWGIWYIAKFSEDVW